MSVVIIYEFFKFRCSQKNHPKLVFMGTYVTSVQIEHITGRNVPQ